MYFVIVISTIKCVITSITMMRECQNRVFKTAQKKITSHLITPPDVIYHYTDAKGLCGIIESECIWATHSGFLNDARELTYSFDVMRNLIARNNSLEELRQHFLAKISEHIDTTEAYSPFAYVVCFCTDSNLLSQWRGYGSMGNGVAIGFRTAALTKLMNQNEFLKKCIYDEYIHEQFFASCIDAAYQCFKSAWKKASQQQKQDTLDASVSGFYNAVAHLLLLFKSCAFREEGECRIISLGPITGRSGIKHRATGNLIIPYFEMSLKDDEAGISVLPINDIVVGPGRNPLLLEKAINQLLRNRGYGDIPIQRSNIPLRA